VGRRVEGDTEAGKKAMYEQLMEGVVREENAAAALRAVMRNKGAPGIDNMTTEELEGHLKRHWESIKSKLLAGTYVATPVKRVEIPKPDGGLRMLGIPTVLDRFIQQMLLNVLTPIYEPMFSESSYGFRPGRSAPDAVKEAQRYAKEGRRYVVDIDIAKFFDRVNHDILMTRIGKTIRDKRVLRLIGRYLRSGALINGVRVMSEEGTPQGGPLSPLLANIYLDTLDKELESRGHKFCRYADDSNIYVGSEQAAQRVLENVTQWLEKELRLKVNEEKTGVGKVWERKFLGFQLNGKLEIAISPKSAGRFKDKVRELWKSCQSRTSKELLGQWRAWLRGWCNYYKLAQDRRSVTGLEGWIRRRIRCCFWLRWHSRKGRLNKLRKLGCTPRQCETAHSGKGAWGIAKSPSLHVALSNAVLRRYGFLMPSEAFG
jgi:group II intron reverse transcriptase/maturase